MSRNLIVIAALLCFFCGTTHAREPGVATITTPNSKALMREGDRLADSKEYSGALLKYKQAYEDILVRLRKLEFKREVTPKLLPRDRLRQRMAKTVREEYDAAEMRMMGETFKVFGLAPQSLDIEQTIVALYTEEVAGFYDSKEKSLFLIDDVERRSEPDGFFTKLLGLSNFKRDEQKVILAHELTHALHDQHYDLTGMQERAKTDDDRLLALIALIEGDATVVMFAEQQRLQGRRPNIHLMPPAVMNVSFIAMRAFLPFSSGDTLSKAPRIFADSMLFPYHKGSVFVMHLTNKGGWDAVDRAWKDLPLSTEQILHPEKYLKEPRDVPQALEIPPLTEVVDEDWDLLGKNVMGEFQIRSMLAQIPLGSRAAAGWDGDQYLTYQSKSTNMAAFVWLTTWDSENDAKEFAISYEAYLHRRLGIKLDATKDDAEQQSNPFQLPQFDGDYRYQKGTQTYRIFQRDSDIAVVEGFNTNTSEAIIQQVFAATRVNKTH